ncbi:glycine receptor subunit alpha-2-like isoform X2 [Lineus longissimus]
MSAYWNPVTMISRLLLLLSMVVEVYLNSTEATVISTETKDTLSIYSQPQSTSPMRSSFELDAFIKRQLTGYEKKVRPGAKTPDIPVLVTCDLFINDFSSVSEINMEYTMDVFFRQMWKDERLKFRNVNYKKPIVLGHSHYSELWVPDTFFVNEKVAAIHHVTTPNKLLWIEPDGTILYSQRVSLTLSCPFYLAKYPMDNQTCQLFIESFGYTSTDLSLTWRKENPIQKRKGLELPEFDFGKELFHTCTHTYNTGDYDCIAVMFTLYRRMGYYMIQTYIPTMLIVILSWISFWLDVNATPARISVGLLTVLTITTQSSGLRGQLPKVSYIKAIDVWQAGCLIFVFGAMIEFAVANVLARREDYAEEKRLRALRERENEERYKAKKLIKTDYGDLTDRSLSSPYRKVNQFMSEDTIQTKVSNCARLVAIFKPKHYCAKLHTVKSSVCLENMAKVVFPLSFALFNVVYWLYYINMNNDNMSPLYDIHLKDE